MREVRYCEVTHFQFLDPCVNKYWGTGVLYDMVGDSEPGAYHGAAYSPLSGAIMWVTRMSSRREADFLRMSKR